jgi:hypothetical protein
VAKSRRKRQRKRGPRGGPRRTAQGRVSELEQELEQAVDEKRRRAAEAHSPDTPPERIAQILVEDFGGLPSPVGFAHTLAEQDPGRANAVLAEMQRLAPADLVTLTFAADVARTVEGDPARSLVLLGQALDLVLDANAAGPLAMHLLNAGMVVEALEAVDECLRDDPGDEMGQEVLAAALEQLHTRAESAERLDPVERQALDRFSDRTRLYRLRDSIVAFTDARPELQALIATTIKEWLEELAANDLIDLDEVVEGGGELVYERHEAFIRLAIEHAWLREPDEDLEDEEDGFEPEPQPEIEESSAPMALLATDPETPADIASDARNWVETCTYGLWQIAQPAPSPGVWLTEIVSGVRRYAAVPPEQLEPASRWGVLMGALVAIDGIWRTTGAIVHLRPAEADSAAEFVREATDDLVRALTGKRTRRDANRHREPQPHGVLVDAAEPADALLADLISKVIGNLLPTIASEVWRRRGAGPTFTNTDGHRLKLITAQVNVDDPATASERLAAHHDFRTEDEGELTWWGRELTDMEQQSALAHLRAQFGEAWPQRTEAAEQRVRRFARQRTDVQLGQLGARPPEAVEEIGKRPCAVATPRRVFADGDGVTERALAGRPDPASAKRVEKLPSRSTP